jgi:hypothetical protein
MATERRLTTACTRPPARRLLITFRVAGRRVMPGVMPLFLATVMYQVMDTITYRRSWTHRYPEFAARGDGVMALLEPSQINEPPEIQGRTVTVHKPDGNVSQLIAAGSEAHRSVVGIFFSGVSADEIPRGSLIEW